MGTIIYNNASPKNCSSHDAIGQVADSGIVYTSPFSISATTAIGQVYNDGIVYNRLNAKSWEFAIGHVNSSGIIYSTPVTEYNDDAIGHVNSAGVVYCTAYSEYNSDIVGHVQGPDKRAAAAALLLLLKGDGAAGGSGYGAGSAYQGESVVAKATGFLTDLEFDISDRIHGRYKPCKGCGKKISPRDYEEQDGRCLWCKAKYNVWKEKISKARKLNFKCPDCGKSFSLIFPAGVTEKDTVCPNPRCRAQIIAEDSVK